jgi:hypothetical protein
MSFLFLEEFQAFGGRPPADLEDVLFDVGSILPCLLRWYSVTGRSLYGRIKECTQHKVIEREKIDVSKRAFEDSVGENKKLEFSLEQIQ